jgi:hypothetical protein
VAETIEALERRIDELRVKVREAMLSGERALASAHRTSLKQAEQAWEDALAEATRAPAGLEGSAPHSGLEGSAPHSGLEGSAPHRGLEAAAPSDPADPADPADPPGSLLPLREQVYEALSLLQVPAAPKLIATVHEAFFGSTFPTTRVTSLKRDEERSFRTAPFARPYYICAALSADYLSQSRGLLAVSTWPLEVRMIGSLSPRVDFLTEAIRVAEAIERIPEPPMAARRLLERFAASIPGASSSGGAGAGAGGGGARPAAVREAAAAELAVHADGDAKTRRAAAERARRLDGAEQLFGTTAFREMAGKAAAE